MGVSMEDPRSERTRRLLVEAFVELCASGGSKPITVADIARKAGVNRSTVYLHFEDLDDLADRGFALLLENYGKRYLEKPPNMGEEAWLSARMTSLFELIMEKRPFFLRLLKGNQRLLGRSEEFLERFLVENRFTLLLPKEDGSAMPLPLLSRTVVAVLLSCAQSWLEAPGKISAADMAGFYIRFVRAGISASGYLEMIDPDDQGKV